MGDTQASLATVDPTDLGHLLDALHAAAAAGDAEAARMLQLLRYWMHSPYAGDEPKSL